MGDFRRASMAQGQPTTTVAVVPEVQAQDDSGATSRSYGAAEPGLDRLRCAVYQVQVTDLPAPMQQEFRDRSLAFLRVEFYRPAVRVASQARNLARNDELRETLNDGFGTPRRYLVQGVPDPAYRNGRNLIVYCTERPD